MCSIHVEKYFNHMNNQTGKKQETEKSNIINVEVKNNNQINLVKQMWSYVVIVQITQLCSYSVGQFHKVVDGAVVDFKFDKPYKKVHFTAELKNIRIKVWLNFGSIVGPLRPMYHLTNQLVPCIWIMSWVINTKKLLMKL